jgi:hypothetical protein
MAAAFQNTLDAWRTADAAARAAEDEVMSALLQAVESRAKPPTPEHLERARKLRKAADALLQLAIAELKADADSRPCRRRSEGASLRP